MTARDRLVIMVVGVALALIVGWMAFVSPEQKKAAKVQKEVDSASSQLSAAESQLNDARTALCLAMGIGVDDIHPASGHDMRGRR